MNKGKERIFDADMLINFWIYFNSFLDQIDFDL